MAGGLRWRKLAAQNVKPGDLVDIYSQGFDQFGLGRQLAAPVEKITRHTGKRRGYLSITVASRANSAYKLTRAERTLTVRARQMVHVWEREGEPDA